MTVRTGQVRRLVHVQISSSDEIRKSQKSSLSFDLFDMDATQFSISRLFNQDILLFCTSLISLIHGSDMAKMRFNARKMSDPVP